MPPTASYFSRKKLKCRQRLVQRNELVDMSMNAMTFNAPSVDEIMKSPLVKIITFSANDFCFRGNTKGLIVNWVHLLIMKPKAAASKEDNPNLWEAMCGAFADEYCKAAVPEVKTLEEMYA